MTRSKRQLENLKGNSFKDDPSRINLKGRPKGKTITTLIKEKLDGDKKIKFKGAELLDADGKPTGQKVDVLITVATKEQIIIAALNRATRDQRTMEYLVDRLEGKPSQKLMLNTTEKEVITYEDFNSEDE